jgi:alginate O-acetyltransferase complex protein AlgI
VGNTSATFSYLEETALLDYFWLWIAAIILCMPVRKAVANFVDNKIQPSFAAAPYIVATCRAVISVALLVLCVALLVGATNNAFIYTRF